MRARALFVFVVSLAVAGCQGGSAPTWTFPPAPTGGQAAAPSASAPSGASPDPAPASAAPGSPAPAGDVLGAIDVEAFDLGFTPATVNVDEPGTYEVRFVNAGAIIHDITFADGTKLEADAGESASGTVNVPEGGIAFICSIPGHADAGMTGAVTLHGQTGESGGNAGGDHGGPPPATDVEADPDAPEYVPFDPVAPAIREGETHEIELVIEEKEMTVAPGFVQAVWTFGGTVPGPTIRVKVGDTIRVRLRNSEANRLPHSIDFHASQVAWNDEMVSINPGEELLYEWTANHAGVWMYHCGTAPALHHIANGMFGMVIVEPAEGLPEVEHEFAIVQSEWYLGPQGEPVNLQKASEGAPSPDFVVFNGVANQYSDNPIEVPTGETVRMFVLDAGPSVDSSFHVVGTIFDSVIKEGVRLESGNAGNWGAQAVDLSPAQGAIVEFTTPEDGLYPFVTHAFNFVGRGALGVIQAGDGDPKN